MGVTARGRMAWWIAAAVAAAAYAAIAPALVHVWRTDTYAAHGLFVPLFSAYLLWSERAHLREPGRPAGGAGPAVVLGGLVLLALALTLRSLLLQVLSAPVTLGGLVLWRYGAGGLRQAWFPIAFLAFMAPVPRPVVAAVSRHLQEWAAAFAAGATSLLGIPVYRRGVIVELPDITLEVAEICNGLRFMSALVVLTVALAQLTQRTRTRKVVLALSAVPVAVLANATRVAALVVASHYYGMAAAQGIVHHSIGKAVWILTLVPIVLLAIVLRRVPIRRVGGGRPAVAGHAEPAGLWAEPDSKREPAR